MNKLALQLTCNANLKIVVGHASVFQMQLNSTIVPYQELTLYCPAVSFPDCRRATPCRVEGEGLPCSFLKIGKNTLIFGKNCPGYVHEWKKFFI